MLKKNYLKTFLQKHGVKIGEICSALAIDRQKFDRWSEDDHPNNRVLRAAVKFAMRYIIDSRDDMSRRIAAIEEAEQEFNRRMDKVGL